MVYFCIHLKAANAEVSAHFAGLMEKPILHEPSPKKIFTLASPPNEPLRDLDCNTLSNTPGPKCRRGIFKVPSQPVIRRCSTTTSFLKRPDRPRDCPSPVMNKRARSCSIAVSSPSTTTTSLIRPEVGLLMMTTFMCKLAFLLSVEQKL